MKKSEASAASPRTGYGRKIRILLADDHSMVRQGLAELLNAEQDMEVVGEASEGQSVISLARKLLSDVVFMDIDMPGKPVQEQPLSLPNRGTSPFFPLQTDHIY